MKTTGFPFLRWRKIVNKNSLKADSIAGLTGAFLVIPQGIAYALIAGLPAEFGLYAAIFSAVIASFFGSSMHMVSGPTAALSIVSAIIIEKTLGASQLSYLSLMFILTFLVGAFQLAFSFLRFGFLVNFISHAVVQGFTAGAALLIAVSQLGNFLGLPKVRGSSFIEYLQLVAKYWESINTPSLIIGLATIFSAVILKYWLKNIPYLLGSMLIGACVCLFLFDPAQDQIDMIKALPKGLPSLVIPDFDLDTVFLLSSGALSIAILGLIEAVAIARSIAMRSKQAINGNQEFYGQGLSNCVGAFFQCYPSSGSFTRSGGNYDAGAKTPFAILFSALIVLGVLLFLPDITQYIPVPVMAGSILIIAWNLFDVSGFIKQMKAPKPDAIPFLLTFLSTLFLPLESAIYVGIVASLTFYLAKTANPKLTVVAPYQVEEGIQQMKNVNRYGLPECPAIKMVRLDGSIFFGAAESFQESIRCLVESNVKRLILICKGMNFVDVTGQHTLAEEIERIQQSGGTIFFSSLKGNTLDDFTDDKLQSLLKSGVLKDSTKNAISAMVAQVPADVCQTCANRVFQECPSKPKL
ncbi:SulP family inorganic anion transporter [Marinomonas sp. 5E14-1]|uniref:SulP family inorganic anion transporter n=1 Tax=Marinomonas sp. 5E14-1 TaxID=3153922 RepID=UPI003264D069